jgi:hypothetical protein
MNEYSYMKNGTEHSTILAKNLKEAKRQFDGTFGKDCQVYLSKTAKELLVDNVIMDIEKDIFDGDTDTLTELLLKLPRKQLEAFLRD